MEYIKAIDLPEAWFLSLREIALNGEGFPVGRGSEETFTKKIAVCLEIENPGKRPLLHEKAPTDSSYLNEYVLKYLFSSERAEGEEYTYGERMRAGKGMGGEESVDQVLRVCDRLKEEPLDRQCTIVLRYPSDIESQFPPCLTVLDVEVLPLSREEGKELNFYAYFRSWDAFAGLPTNLGGLQLLKEWMAREIGVDDGKMYAFSKNLHVYKRNFQDLENVLEGSSDERQFKISETSFEG